MKSSSSKSFCRGAILTRLAAGSLDRDLPRLAPPAVAAFFFLSAEEGADAVAEARGGPRLSQVSASWSDFSRKGTLVMSRAQAAKKLVAKKEFLMQRNKPVIFAWLHSYKTCCQKELILQFSLGRFKSRFSTIRMSERLALFLDSIPNVGFENRTCDQNIDALCPLTQFPSSWLRR